MPKNTFVILCLSAFLCVGTTQTINANTNSRPDIERDVARFNDDFSGKAISSWRWKTNSVPVILSNGVAQFRSTSNLFPYISTQANPFPETQKFSVEFGFRYRSVADRGTGMVVHQFAPSPGDPPYYGTNWQFQVWQDTIRPLQIIFNGNVIYQASSLDLNTHTAKWIRTDMDRVYLDNTLIYTTAIAMANPKAIWIGNFADDVTPGAWSSFDMDFVRVLRLDNK